MTQEKTPQLQQPIAFRNESKESLWSPPAPEKTSLHFKRFELGGFMPCQKSAGTGAQFLSARPHWPTHRKIYFLFNGCSSPRSALASDGTPTILKLGVEILGTWVAENGGEKRGEI